MDFIGFLVNKIALIETIKRLHLNEVGIQFTNMKLWFALLHEIICLNLNNKHLTMITTCSSRKQALLLLIFFKTNFINI
jgi:hypothetical protein